MKDSYIPKNSIEASQILMEYFNVDTKIYELSNSFFQYINAIGNVVRWQKASSTQKTLEYLIRNYNNEDLAKHIFLLGSRIEKENLKNHDLYLQRENIIDSWIARNDDFTFANSLYELALVLQRKALGDIEINLEQKEVWNEDLSTKLITNIPLNSIKFPYKNFCINVGNYNWTLDNQRIVHIYVSILNFVDNQEDNRITILLIPEKATSSDIFNLYLNQSINENYQNSEYLNENNKKEIIFIVGRIVSICMYLENFKNDKKRIVLSARKIKKNKKKQINEDKLIRTIKLIQPIDDIIESYSLDGEKSKKEYNKAFWVRGHFRQQSYKNDKKERYNKLIWIDPFIKGKDKELLKKVIKI